MDNSSRTTDGSSSFSVYENESESILEDETSQYESAIDDNFTNEEFDDTSLTKSIDLSKSGKSFLDSDSVYLNGNPSGEKIIKENIQNSNVSINNKCDNLLDKETDIKLKSNNQEKHLQERSSSNEDNVGEGPSSKNNQNDIINYDVSQDGIDLNREIKIYNTLEEFEQNLPHTVKILKTPSGCKVYLVGTAHFSQESEIDVAFVIRNVRPDVVMIELCTSRIHILTHEQGLLFEEAINLSFSKVYDIIRSNGTILGLFYVLLLHVTSKISGDLGKGPGGEFRRAFDEVQRLPHCQLHLGDRPISITIARAFRSLSFCQVLKLVWNLRKLGTITAREIEECKNHDILEALLQEMAGEFPIFHHTLVDERDLYLCHSLQIASLPIPQNDGTMKPVKVVGVVGIGHTPGIVKNWMKVQTNQIEKILEIPPYSQSTKIIFKTIKFCFYSAFMYGTFVIIKKVSHMSILKR